MCIWWAVVMHRVQHCEASISRPAVCPNHHMRARYRPTISLCAVVQGFLRSATPTALYNSYPHSRIISGKLRFVRVSKRRAKPGT